MNTKRNQGFTLIELMIVIAIVAILVALAVPAYRDYTIRTKVGECINAAAVPKLQISEYRQTVGAWPATADEAGLTNLGNTQYCAQFTSYVPGTGSFEIDVDEPAVDGSIAGIIQPRMAPWVSVSGEVNWICSRGAATPVTNVKYLPSTCRGAST